MSSVATRRAVHRSRESGERNAYRAPEGPRRRPEPKVRDERPPTYSQPPAYAHTAALQEPEDAWRLAHALEEPAPISRIEFKEDGSDAE